MRLSFNRIDHFFSQNENFHEKIEQFGRVVYEAIFINAQTNSVGLYFIYS